MAKFEVISIYKDAGLVLPTRATECAAGYDFSVAEDTLIPPYQYLYDEMIRAAGDDDGPKTLDDIEKIAKAADAKITLVPTGIKCYMEEDEYLEISARSSLPLKHWLIIGNAIGIIDADYTKADNEGHIMFQVINLSPFPIILKKGEKIGQGILKHYGKTEDDIPGGQRTGGFGSTNG